MGHHSLQSVNQPVSKASQTDLQDLVLVKHKSKQSFLLRVSTPALLHIPTKAVTRIWYAGDGRLPTAAAEVKSLDEILGCSLI